MPLTDHVTLSITQDSVGVTRAGFGTLLILSATATWAERTRTYDSLAAVAVDFPVTSGFEYVAAKAAFSQNPKPVQIKIGRAALKPTRLYTGSLVDAVAGNTYAITAKGSGVTATVCTYTALADVVVTSVANATETFTTVGHGMATGDGPYRLTNSGGGLPAGVAVDTNYWIIRLTADTYQLASTYANAIALTPVAITTDGTGTHTVQRDANDVIVAILVDRLNSVVGKNYTAAQVPGAGDTDTLTVTGNAAGNWFSLEASSVSRIAISQTHVDPGVATDLAAIVLQDDDWYALCTGYNSKAYVGAAAAWIETVKKIYIAAGADTTAVTVAVASADDTPEDLFDLAYDRTAWLYHPSPYDCADAAWLGRVLPYDPGSETWKFKTLTGVNPVSLTATHRVNLRARKANTYETTSGVSITWEGTMASGDFIDVTRGLDWLDDDMSAAVFAALAGATKIPYTDAGVAVVESEVRASLKRAFERGIITEDFTVTVPLVADVSAANKLARLLPDIRFSATLAGAIHKTTISGVISV